MVPPRYHCEQRGTAEWPRGSQACPSTHLFGAVPPGSHSQLSPCLCRLKVPKPQQPHPAPSSATSSLRDHLPLGLGHVFSPHCKGYEWVSLFLLTTTAELGPQQPGVGAVLPFPESPGAPLLQGSVNAADPRVHFPPHICKTPPAQPLRRRAVSELHPNFLKWDLFSLCWVYP